VWTLIPTLAERLDGIDTDRRVSQYAGLAALKCESYELYSGGPSGGRETGEKAVFKVEDGNHTVRGHHH